MTVVVNMEANSSRLEAALSRISLRFRGIEAETAKINKSVGSINSVKIDTKSSVAELQRLNNQVQTTSKNLESTSRSIVGAFKTLAVGLSATFAGLGIIKAADDLTRLENKVALVVGRGKELNATMSELVKISNRSFANLDNTASTFSKIKSVSKDTALSMNQMMTATESIQKALMISGSSTEGQAAAILQLTQGLGAGVLRGEEFNSIMENGYRIAVALADELGVGVGQLRGLAESGAITKNVMLSAMLNQASAINTEFANVNPTIAQLGQTLTGTFSRVIATIDRTVGLTSAFSWMIKTLNSTIQNNASTIDSLAYAYATTLKLAIEDVILVLGGVFNVFAAIGKRAAAAIPTFITPMLTLFDVLDLAGSRAVGHLFVNVLDGLMGIRIAVMDLFDNQIAVAIRKLFQARDAISIRRGLDDLAVAFETVGLRWYNVINKITIIGRGMNIWLLKTGIFLGFIDQRLLRLRYASIEQLGKTFEYVSIVVLEMVMNLLTLSGIVDIFVGIETAVKFVGRVIESFAPDFSSKLADERTKIGKILYYIGVDLNAFGLKAGLAIAYIFLKTAGALQKLYLKPFVKTKEDISTFVGSLKSLAEAAGPALASVLEKLGTTFEGLFSKVRSLFSPAEEVISDFTENSKNSLESFKDNIANSEGFQELAGKIKDFVSGLSAYLSDNKYFQVFVSNMTALKDSLASLVDKIVATVRSLKDRFSASFDDLNNTFTSTYPTAKNALDKTLAVVLDFVKKVEYGFFWVYDRVVGNSWWPDLISKIASEAYRLRNEVLPEIELFVGIIDSLFYKLSKATGLDIQINLPSLSSVVAWFKENIDMLASSVFSSIGNSFKAVKDFSPEIGNQIGLAIIGALLAALSAAGVTTWVGLVTFTTFVSAFDSAFKLAGESILDSGIIQQVFESAGNEVGKLITKIIDNIPVLVEILVQGAGQFTSALLSQLGIVGSVISSILSIIPGGGLIELLLFGSTIGIIFGKLDAVKTALNIFLSFLTGSAFGGVGMDKKGKNPTGILGYLLFGNGRLIFGLASAVFGIVSTFKNIIEGVASFSGVATTLGLVGFSLFGGIGAVSVITATIDKIAEAVLRLFNITPTFSLWDYVMNIYTSPSKSLKDKFNEMLAGITKNNGIGDKLTESIKSINLDTVKSKFNNAVQFMQVYWYAFTTGIAAKWTAFTTFMSTSFTMVSTRFTAFVATVRNASILSGPMGWVGRAMFGLAGIAIIMSLFSGAANAATGDILDSVSSVTSYVPMGLLGLFLLGATVNPKGAVLLVLKAISTSFSFMFKMGKLLLISAGVTGFVGKALLGALSSNWLTRGLMSLTPILVSWAASAGFSVLFTIQKVLGTTFALSGAAITALSTSIGLVIPVVGALLVAFLAFGSSMTDWIGNVIFGLTGIGSAARKTKKELQDILTVDKVGQIDVVLKSKLDKINLSVLSEKELANLKRELTTTNSILEKNKSTFELEGDLTRTEIKETNNALTRANELLDRLANKGETSFAGGLLAELNKKTDISSLEEAIRLSLGDNVKNETQLNKVVAPVFNKLQEVLDNPNATNEDAATALLQLQRLLSDPRISDSERRTIRDELVPNFAQVTSTLDRFSGFLETMSTGMPVVISQEDMSFLANAFALALDTSNNKTAFSGNAFTMSTRFNPAIADYAKVAEEELRAMAKDRGISTKTSSFSVMNLGYQERDMTASEIYKALGISFKELQDIALSKTGRPSQQGYTNLDYFSELNAKTMQKQLEASEALTKTNEILTRQFVGGTAAQVGLNQEAQRRDVDKRLKSFKETGLSFSEYDIGKATEDDINKLRSYLEAYDASMIDLQNQTNRNIIDGLRESGQITQTQYDLILKGAQRGDDELMNKLRELGIKGFLTPGIKKAWEAAEKKLESGVNAIAANSFGGIIPYLNEQLQSENLDVELEFVKPGQYDLVLATVDAVKEARKLFEADPNNKNWFNLETDKLEAELMIGDLKDNLKSLSEAGVDMPDLNQILSLDPAHIKRIINAAKAIALLDMSIEAFGDSATANMLNAPVGGVGNTAAALAARRGALMAMITTPFENNDGEDSVADSGGGAAKTWWEAFKEGISSMNLSLSDDFLSSISQQTLDSLVTASNKYKAAQEAINKSAATEVELRKASLEQMRLAKLEAIDALDDGTFGGVKAQFDALGAGLDASFIGSLSPVLLDYAQAVAKQIELLRLQADSLEAGSVELQTTTLAMDQLKMKLEELQSSAKVMRDAFEEGMSSFLKGESTFKDFLNGLLDTFTNTIIEKFSKGFTDSLFSSLNLDNFFSGLFSGALDLGTSTGTATAGLFGELGSSVANAMWVRSADGGLGGVVGQVGGAGSSSSATQQGFFGQLFSGISGFFGKLFSGIGSIFSGLFSGGGLFGGIFNMFSGLGGNWLGGFAEGGMISGPGTGTSDSILARLSNGEFVMNAASTKRWLPFLETLNANDGRLPAFASGGLVGPSNPSAFKAMKENTNKDKQQVFNINVTGDVSRQTRKEIVNMIPEITSGVNMTNRERGSR